MRLVRKNTRDGINLVRLSLSFSNCLCLISNADHIWRLTIENSYTNTILMNPSVLIFARPRSAQQFHFHFAHWHYQYVNTIQCANLCAYQRFWDRNKRIEWIHTIWLSLSLVVRVLKIANAKKTGTSARAHTHKPPNEQWI